MQELALEVCQAGAEAKSMAVIETLSMATAWVSQRSAVRVPGELPALTTWNERVSCPALPSEAGWAPRTAGTPRRVISALRIERAVGVFEVEVNASAIVSGGLIG